MAFGFVVAIASLPDQTKTKWVIDAKVTITAGTYPAGGVGPLGLAAAAGIAVGNQSPVPAKSWQASAATPPSGYFWVYNPGTDKLQAYVAQGSGAAAAEFSGSLTADIVEVQQWFVRGT